MASPSNELWTKLLLLIYSYGNKIQKTVNNNMLRKLLLVPYLLLDFLIVKGILNCIFTSRLTIGIGINIWHPYGIVIHDQVVIGDNVTIRQQVTIGKASKNSGVPVIKNNVVIGAGAKIIGAVTIGENTVIGANAVVTKSCAANAVLVGVPAKDISDRKKNEFEKKEGK